MLQLRYLIIVIVVLMRLEAKLTVTFSSEPRFNDRSMTTDLTELEGLHNESRKVNITPSSDSSQCRFTNDINDINKPGTL